MRQRRLQRKARVKRRAFSLVELVIVVVIIGVISAIAMPRMSAATTRASSNALQATLANVRKAVDCYFAEHGKYPGYNPGTGLKDNAFFIPQLTTYSDATGNVNAAPSGVFIFGPYLRTPFPSNPTNKLDTVHVKGKPSDSSPAVGTVGWVAVLSHGYFGISASDADLGDIGIKDVKLLADVKGGVE